MDTPAPPQAARRPHTLTAHGDERIDDWYWLADREDPDVVAYLEAENDFADAILAPTRELQAELFDEIKARVVETDASAPSRHGPWWYWSRTEEGRQYRSYARLADPERRREPVDLAEAVAAGPIDGEQVVLDENELAEGTDYFALGVLDISPDHRIVAYATDTDGSERYQLRFRDVETGELLADQVADVTYGSAWAADVRTFFYVRPDEAMRPYQVWRHALGTPVTDDVLVHTEPDEHFFVSVGLTRSERYVVIAAESKMTAEYRAIEADDPEAEPVVILPRRQGVEYDVEHARWGDVDAWLVRTNDPDATGPATNFRVAQLPVDQAGSWDGLEPLLPHRPEVKVQAIEAFATHLVVSEREAGLEQLRVIPVTSAGPTPDASSIIEQPDAVYSLGGGANADWDTDRYRFGYTSLITPPSTVDHLVPSGQREVIRQQPVRGYRPDDYRTERIWATAPDGTQVPISLVARADTPVDGTAPCLLYGYGSYEITIDPTFSALRVNLLERGMVFAIAHIRGGGELGRTWYEQGRLEHKATTFSDFVACGEHLIATGWSAPDRLAARGGSAGGLLMGAVVNARPDLWRAVVAEVPFVDVVTTMSDESLPLTVTEWEEWGNPVADADAYRTMLAYSPYDNVADVPHPALYVTGGLNDPRVGYWEPAKWVAKLRSLPSTAASGRHVVLRMEMGAGHQGASGRYEIWKDEARVQAFVLTELGVEGHEG